VNKTLLMLVFLTGCKTITPPEPLTSPVIEPEVDGGWFVTPPPCGPFLIEYRDNTQAEAYDESIIKTAVRRCGELYPNSPCLVKMVKLKDYSYYLICGARP